MKKQKVKSYFAIHEAVVLTGFSKYMLDYLVREEIFIPTEPFEGGRGRRRQYSYTDLVFLRALSSICKSKGKILHLGKALSKLRNQYGPIAPGNKLVGHLLVQGSELCIRTGSEAIEELRTGQLTLSFAVDLHGIANQLDECIVINNDGFLLVPKVAKQAEAERQRIWGSIRGRREALRKR